MATITTTEAAAELGVTVRRVRAMCVRGRIAGARQINTQRGMEWMIPSPVVRVPGRRGRPTGSPQPIPAAAGKE